MGLLEFCGNGGDRIRGFGEGEGGVELDCMGIVLRR